MARAHRSQPARIRERCRCADLDKPTPGRRGADRPTGMSWDLSRCSGTRAIMSCHSVCLSAMRRRVVWSLSAPDAATPTPLTSPTPRPWLSVRGAWRQSVMTCSWSQIVWPRWWACRRHGKVVLMRHRLPRGVPVWGLCVPSGKTGSRVESSRPCRCRRAQCGSGSLASGGVLAARARQCLHGVRGLECGPRDFRGPHHKHGRIARSSRAVSAGLGGRVAL